MSFKIIISDYFNAEAKKLAKKYRSFKEDLTAFQKELAKNPHQGVEIAPNVRKIRMTIHSKGRGKSGGARVITFNALISESDGIIALLLIYDKADTSNIKKNIVAEIIRSLGL